MCPADICEGALMSELKTSGPNPISGHDTLVPCEHIDPATDSGVAAVDEHPAEVAHSPQFTPASQVISSKCLEYVQQYNGFKKAAAEGIVGLADTLYRAKRELPAIEFDYFCREVGLDQTGSTFRKIMKIGEMAPRFERLTMELPNSWTTLYRLASLNNSEFTRIKKSGRFSPLMTAKDVSEALGRRAGRSKTNPRRDLTISLSNVDETDVLGAYEEILALMEKFHFSVQPSREFAERMVELKRNR
jgi:hypothetical protein